MHTPITISTSFIVMMVSINQLFIVWFIDYKNFITVKQAQLLTLGIVIEIFITLWVQSSIVFFLLTVMYLLHYYCYLSYLKNWLLASFLSIFSYLLIISSWFITYDLPRLLIDFHLYSSYRGILTFYVIQQAFILCEIFIVKYFNRKYKLLDSLLLLKKNYKWIGIGLLLLFSLLILFLQKKAYLQHTETYILTFITISFLCFSLWMFIWLSKEIQQTESLLSEKQQYLYNQIDNTMMTEEFRHDYKNILTVLHHLIIQKDYPAAEEYLESLIDYSHDLLLGDNYPMIQNIQIASVRNLFYGFLKKCEDVDCPLTINVPEVIDTIQINIVDYIRILSLLMDNALEASEDEKDPAIVLMFYRKNGFIEFSLRNRVSTSIPLQSIIKKKYTTKANHTGQGLHILDKILHSYKHAQYKLSVKNQFFEVIVQIPEFPI